ncbi:hypothetical protein P4S79_09710 [Aeribacillus composti]|nr:hypothetical protein [Aeribacillus composti]
MDIQDPRITRTLRTGYPNMVAQPEHVGIDYFGEEILIDDDIVEDPNTGETVLRDNLERYLSEVYDFKFQTAK